MGKRFGIRGHNINIARFVDMMKQTVRHHSQLQHILLDAELSHEHSSSARIIRSSLRTRFQIYTGTIGMASKEIVGKIIAKIERIAAEEDLRHRRTSKSKIASGDQNIGP